MMSRPPRPGWQEEDTASPTWFELNGSLIPMQQSRPLILEKTADATFFVSFPRLYKTRNRAIHQKDRAVPNTSLLCDQNLRRSSNRMPRISSASWRKPKIPSARTIQAAAIGN